MDKKSDLLQRRRQKIEELKAAGVSLYPNKLSPTHTVDTVLALTAGLGEDVGEDATYIRVAGRMMAINRFGKSSFIRFRDRTGQLQAYVRERTRSATRCVRPVQAAGYRRFRRARKAAPCSRPRPGNGPSGPSEIHDWCASPRVPLPEKFHGLKDPEKRYRQRYIDLIMNSRYPGYLCRRSRIDPGRFEPPISRPA
jgi:lysyl-tRNA synthetase class 2